MSSMPLIESKLEKYIATRWNWPRISPTHCPKDRIDAELADADPWGEQYKNRPYGYMQQRGAA